MTEHPAGFLRRNYRRLMALGPRGALQYHFQKQRMRHDRQQGLYALRSRHARFPLLCRAHSSDRAVFDQVFVELQYRDIAMGSPVGLVVDAGANVGYASAFFLTQFPGCELVAIEPDPDNYALLCHNLAPYGDRARLLHAALWSGPADLEMSPIPYREGLEAARQVRARPPGQGTGERIPGLGVREILAQARHRRISLLKMDIEGAEAVVFAQGAEAWLGYVDNLVIELHDDSAFGRASDLFHEAIGGQGFAISQRGELTICRRPARRREAR